MEHSFRSPSWQASRFVILVAQFVDRRISAEDFATRFRTLERADAGYLDRDISAVVRKLSVDVGAYRGDVKFLGVDFIDGEQLWRASGEAFRDLLTLQSELLDRTAG
ncbi:homoserine dehydrogenase [Rhodococcus sp. G-MC3]|uniref:homoserine dehydrogenase n=1 Tax=Rhodococcus sp. G-MC3 TaxID=3046209 RepID=UPI0024BA3C78|nr:homoserine dehydrogenase [Rhodococcus sp. G-MC3]MDJ0395775.1 homoserine dehydrogenase [Rhodococcus sp. G-MC3]